MSRILFDLETAPLPDAADYLIEPIEAPSNWKDPIKIDAYIAEKQAERLGRCALDPDLCQIIAVGVLRPQGDVLVLDREHDTEQSMVNVLIVASEYVGFNILAFDLPVLFTRARYLGIRANPHIELGRYRHPAVTDLAALLTLGHTQRMQPLS